MRFYTWFIPAVAIIAAIIGAVFLVRIYFCNLVDRRIAAFQKDLISKHYEEVQNIYREMRSWRHDFHNHIQVMKAYRTLEQNDKLDAYLVNLDNDLTNVDKLIKSGNVMVDAILNSKLSLARNKNIAINAKAVVPVELSVSEIDLCVIIGNLLDNAMEACVRLDSEAARFIRVYIDIKREHLYVSVINTSGGETRKLNGRYLSSKGVNHGFGLLKVDRLVSKYGGYIKRRNEEGAFSSEIMLPL